MILTPWKVIWLSNPPPLWTFLGLWPPHPLWNFQFLLWLPWVPEVFSSMRQGQLRRPQDNMSSAEGQRHERRRHEKISYLENTGSRSTTYVSMPHPNESSILPKFLEKSNPEVARPAFSTWPVQKSQPKAFEVCTSTQIHQSVYRDQTNIPVRGRVVVLNCQWSLYADWWIWINAHTSNAFGWDFCTLYFAAYPTITNNFHYLLQIFYLSFLFLMDRWWNKEEKYKLGAMIEYLVWR